MTSVMITVIECMGRHAGWLTAAASLRRHERALLRLYLPARGRLRHGQVPCRRHPRCYNEKRQAASSPSPRASTMPTASFVSEAKTSGTDGFGHAQLGGLAALLANVVKEKTGAKVRGIELSPAAALRRALRVPAPTSRRRSAPARLAVEETLHGQRPTRWSASRCDPRRTATSASMKLFDLTDVRQL